MESPVHYVVIGRTTTLRELGGATVFDDWMDMLALCMTEEPVNVVVVRDGRVKDVTSDVVDLVKSMRECGIAAADLGAHTHTH